MTDETGPDIERLTQEMRAFSAYELAAQACQHLNNAAASIRPPTAPCTPSVTRRPSRPSRKRAARHPYGCRP